MNRARSVIFATAVVALACSACTRPHAIKQYQKDGIQFTYYSDWKVTQDAPVDGNPLVRTINIEGPDQAVVVLICTPPSAAQTLEDFAAAVSDKRGAVIENKLSIGSLKAAEVSKSLIETTTGAVAGQQRQGILQRFSINLLGTQVPHEARFFQVRGSKYRIFVLSQAAVANLAATRSGSELILSTLGIEGAS